MTLQILGMGASHPTTVIDNKFLEDLNVGTSAEWIIDKIGIEQRLSTLPLDYISKTRNQDPQRALEVASINTTELGAKAAQMALSKAGISANQIGLLIANTCTPSQFVPCEAQRLAEALEYTGKAYDVQTACPAFALHIDYLANFQPELLPDYILCVSSATLTHRVNYNDRTDGAIWGDCAAAWVVSPRKPGKLKVLYSSYMADPLRCEAVVVDTFGYFHQDGRAVRDFSVRQTVRLIKQIEQACQIDWQRDIFVGHQANATMLRQITENREIPQSNHWQNVSLVGNQAGAGAPAVMAANWERIKPGQKIVVAVVGAGLSWGSVVFEALE